MMGSAVISYLTLPQRQPPVMGSLIRSCLSLFKRLMRELDRQAVERAGPADVVHLYGRIGGQKFMGQGQFGAAFPVREIQCYPRLDPFQSA